MKQVYQRHERIDGLPQEKGGNINQGTEDTTGETVVRVNKKAIGFSMIKERTKEVKDLDLLTRDFDETVPERLIVV